ncbi:MAG: polysaccharide deacetylase family protein [Undibacterium sp.]|nr:polysaccharide deacetylase family protein [Undibacterium sp.]
MLILLVRFRSPLRLLLASLLLSIIALAAPSCEADEADDSATTPAPIRFLISFDDGPSGADYANPTAQVLRTLAQNEVQAGIKAIFFTQTRAINGGGSINGKALLKREHDEGHLLAFHTATPRHSNHRYLTEEEFDLSLKNGIADITAITGTAPKLVRPPFWNYDGRTLAAYHKYGMQLLLTDLNANDGKIWGVNFSLTKRRNMLKQLTTMQARWQSASLQAVDGATPIIVTFHDINSYTAHHVEEYLHILLEVARELNMTVASKAFYDDRVEIERAALAKTVRDMEVKTLLPGFWNWLWQ